MMNYRTLVINPGSTSTKIAIFEDTHLLAQQEINYLPADLAHFIDLMDQKDFRIKSIVDFMNKHDFDFQSIDAFVGRGGLMRAIPGGTYTIDTQMISDLTKGLFGIHAANLGAIIADYFGEMYQRPAFVVDPVVVDEFDPVAYLSGYKDWDRRSVFHALNQKAVARQALKQIGKSYENANLIVAHMGGGISVGAHKLGRVVDVNNGLDGDGTYSPNRTGSVSAISLVDYIYDQAPKKSEVVKLITHEGGLKSYLGTDDLKTIEKEINQGDEYSRLIFDGMVYQIAKEIGKQATVLMGQVDLIVLTGGMARSGRLVKAITQRVDWIAPVTVIPGQMEMQALNLGAQRVLQQIEQPKNYVKEAEELANGRSI